MFSGHKGRVARLVGAVVLVGVLIPVFSGGVLAELSGSDPSSSVSTDASPSPTTAPARSTIDTHIGRRSCTLLGRRWVDGGCSRTMCINRGDHAKKDATAETCEVGGAKGPAYGVPIDSRRCKALGRRWVRRVNYCISEPHRTAPAIAHAAQCRGATSTYVELSETEGYYDICLTPQRVATLQAIADRTGQTLGSVTAKRSRTECGYRPRRIFVDGVCRVQKGSLPRSKQGGVLLVGDSVSWRGTQHLAALEPHWDIDAIPGRSVVALADRIKFFREAHGRPTGLIIALGTNPNPRWTKSRYVAALKQAADGAPVMFVTPYRRPGSATPGVVHDTERYTDWMHQIAAAHPVACIADWRKLATDHPNILIDGVHETPLARTYWAEFVDNNWKACVASVDPGEQASSIDVSGDGPVPD